MTRKETAEGRISLFLWHGVNLSMIDHGSSFDKFGDSEINIQIISKERQTKYSSSLLTRFCKNSLQSIQTTTSYMRHLQFTNLHRTITRDLEGLLVAETPGNRSKICKFIFVKLVQSIPPRKKKSIYLTVRRKAKGLITTAGMYQVLAPQI